jgi:2-polyprenyl-3-methyl-5-hydroxy-6-metoxy-1,4-benzoquinol methylase
MSWQTIQNDPNDPRVQRIRKQALLRARALRLVDDREKYLGREAMGKRVLDVGVVAHTPDAYKSNNRLHRHIHEQAAYCLGCDVLGPELEHLKALGYNVICHDITSTPLDERFDLIILGEIIEHLGRPADLLGNCSKMLAPKGKVILTTPNPWFVTYLLRGLFGKAPLVDSVDHVAWYDPATIYELADRAGLRLEKFTGIRASKTYTLKAKLLFALFNTVGKLVLRREAFAKHMIYEFEESADSRVM